MTHYNGYIDKATATIRRLDESGHLVEAGLPDRQADTKTDRHKNRHKDRQTQRQKDTKTDRHTSLSFYSLEK